MSGSIHVGLAGLLGMALAEAIVFYALFLVH
jgi:hypothetical protein